MWASAGVNGALMLYSEGNQELPGLVRKSTSICGGTTGFALVKSRCVGATLLVGDAQWHDFGCSNTGSGH